MITRKSGGCTASRVGGMSRGDIIKHVSYLTKSLPGLKATGYKRPRSGSGETKGSSSAWAFAFNYGYEGWFYRDTSTNGRGFAVRSRR
jgi:hypothetical protein